MKGVSFHKAKNRWFFRKTIDGKRRTLGYFPRQEQAEYLASQYGVQKDENIDTNTITCKRGLDGNKPNLAQSQSDLGSGGVQNNQVSIPRSWRNIEEFNRYIDQLPRTLWSAPNGDIAKLIRRADRIVQVEYESVSGTLHYEVSELKGGRYDFSATFLGAEDTYVDKDAWNADDSIRFDVGTHAYRSLKASTSAFNHRVKKIEIIAKRERETEARMAKAIAAAEAKKKALAKQQSTESKESSL